MRAILRRRRGAVGRFCRGIPRFLGWVRARCGDSAHGGRYRASLAKKFLKKGAKNRKIGAREVLRGLIWAPYIGCAGWFLSLEARPLAALQGVRFVQAPQLRAPAMRHRRETPEIHSSYIGRTNLQTPLLTLWRCLRLSPRNFSNLHLWLEATHLTYPGYDHILSKQIGASTCSKINHTQRQHKKMTAF